MAEEGMSARRISVAHLRLKFIEARRVALVALMLVVAAAVEHAVDACAAQGVLCCSRISRVVRGASRAGSALHLHPVPAEVPAPIVFLSGKERPHRVEPTINHACCCFCFQNTMQCNVAIWGIGSPPSQGILSGKKKRKKIADEKGGENPVGTLKQK